jgi:hypothetical protein
MINRDYRKFYHNITVTNKGDDPLISCGELVIESPFQLNNCLMSFY